MTCESTWPSTSGMPMLRPGPFADPDLVAADRADAAERPRCGDLALVHDPPGRQVGVLLVQGDDAAASKFDVVRMRADGDGDAAQRHDVGVDALVKHHDEGGHTGLDLNRSEKQPLDMFPNGGNAYVVGNVIGQSADLRAQLTTGAPRSIPDEPDASSRG